MKYTGIQGEFSRDLNKNINLHGANENIFRKCVWTFLYLFIYCLFSNHVILTRFPATHSVYRCTGIGLIVHRLIIK